jgi:hypothetical protein
MPTRAQLKRQAEEAAAAAAPAAAPEEGSETPGKKPKAERKTTARAKPKGKSKAEPVPEPAPAAAAPAPATKTDLIELMFPQLRLHVPPEVPDDALREALDAVLMESPIDLDALLVLEEEQERLVEQARLVVMPPEPPVETGSAAAAAAVATPPPVPAPASPAEVEALLAATQARTPPGTISAPTAPVLPDSEAEDSPVAAAPGEPGFSPKPVPAQDSQPPASMAATALSLSSASSMGSVDEEAIVGRFRRLRTLVKSESDGVQAELGEFGERPIDLDALKAADTPTNPVYLIELVEPAEALSTKALGLCVLYRITLPTGAYDIARLLALGVRRGEPPARLTDLLQRFARFLAETYPVQLPQGPVANPSILLQYARRQFPTDAATKTELAATLKELKKKFAYAPYNLQGQQTGLVVQGQAPVAKWDTLVSKAGEVAGEVSYGYTSYAPAESKVVAGDKVTRVDAFNSVTLQWQPSETVVLVSTTAILGEEHPLTLDTGKSTFTWTLSREALTGTSAPMTPLEPALPPSATDLFRMPRGGRRTRRKRATSRRSS